MNIFKRIEVWLLLAIVGGAIWLVTKSEDPASEENEITKGGKSNVVPSHATEIRNSPDAPARPEKFRIEEWNSVPESGGKVISLKVNARNERPEPLVLDSDNVRLVTATGTAVDRFFLPFDEPPVVEANAESTAELRYWLSDKGTEPSDKLWLEIEGERLELELGTNQ